ncbi:hypothetical protein F5876DRAFT_61931 [Lentinula aff. lateritia]|uniref:Uncharacterized protein n=1 Tax=Lentinula aff. lateritia TaxID=2804960 RepID=A0ACC1UD43_9AGAR|nr:hypothetical protein F5876DRAFT_61931 [Lentinula aff. lateritia]
MADVQENDWEGRYYHIEQILVQLKISWPVMIFKDVGKSKAIVAAEFIMNRVPGVLVAPYYAKIQDENEDYHLQFNVPVSVNLVDLENPESLKRLIDGGTEGFKGQACAILPTITSCCECSLDMLNKPTAFPICTIANTPRLPEHCIEWASVLQWPQVHGDKKMDTDNPEDISWLYAVALTWAKKFEIEGVTGSLTQGVVKTSFSLLLQRMLSSPLLIHERLSKEHFLVIDAGRRPKISDLLALFKSDINYLDMEVALPGYTPSTNYDQVTRAWKQGYLGSYDKLLLQNMDSSQSTGDYGNVAAIVQSSGYGESRTVDEIAKQVFTIPMNVRNPIDTSFGAYPPPDLELHEFLAKSGLLVSRTNAFAFVMHLGETVIQFARQMIKDMYDVPLEDVGRSWWLEIRPSMTHSDFATKWREYLLKDISPEYPLIGGTGALVDSIYEAQQGKVRDLMYNMAIRKFKSSLRGWHKAPPVEIKDVGLKNPYVELAEIIPPRFALDLLPKPSMNPFMIFFYIDEAHTLTTSKGRPSPFINLRFALSHLNSLAFALFLSTNSQVDELAEREEKSFPASARGFPSKINPPFTEMPFDLMSGSNGRLELSLLCPTEVDIWEATKVEEDLFRPVSEMSCTRQLALLDSLLGVFIHPRQTEAKSPHLEMIQHHMRTVFTISKNRQIIRSGYPSEPILSSTALSVVRRIDHKYKCDALAEILSTSNSPLAPDPGHRGEQAAMIILLRAYAAAVEEMFSTFATSQSESFHYCKAVPLLKFLKHLFKTEFHSVFVESRPDNHLEGQPFEQAFKDYTVRFNHFVRAENSSVMTAEAAFVMYLRCAAARCSGANNPLDSKKVTAILVSLKRIPFSGKVITHPIAERVVPFFRPFGTKSTAKRLSISLIIPHISLTMNLAASYSKPHNTQEKEKTRENGEQMKHGRGISAMERTMIRNHPEYLHQSCGDQGRSLPHPTEFSIGPSGTPPLLNVDVDQYRSLLQVTDFLADHPRQHTIKEVYAMKPIWTAGFSFGFVNMRESFLTAGIENECIIDGVHARVDETDDETDEDEVADKDQMK